jgi:hypothetical protein
MEDESGGPENSGVEVIADEAEAAVEAAAPVAVVFAAADWGPAAVGLAAVAAGLVMVTTYCPLPDS